MMRVFANPRVFTGLAIVGLFVALALLGPSVAPDSPSALHLSDNLQPPRLEHPFGQDKLGRDVLSRVMYGARVSLVVAVSVVGISACIGLGIGALAGLNGLTGLGGLTGLMSGAR